jgi:hypothetical protein
MMAPRVASARVDLPLDAAVLHRARDRARRRRAEEGEEDDSRPASAGEGQRQAERGARERPRGHDDEQAPVQAAARRVRRPVLVPGDG